MMVDDLFNSDNISLASNVPTNTVDNNLFENHFWGEKHNGFDVLYHNMKHGQVSVKFLQDFIRDSANIQDIHSKHLAKLARQAANSSAVGTFYPMFDVLKVTAEKLSSCHSDVYHKLHEIIKDLSKYVEEQKGKHKQVKDELSGTVNALALIHNTKAAVTKTKEKYHNFCMETEKLRNTAALPKEIEKSEVKAKKAGEEYRHLVEKYSTVRNDFDHKMTESAKRFQDVEEAHLKHMKSVLNSYILSFENATVLIGQVHEEFRRQIDESTIHSLIKHFSENKGTGIEKPAPIVFEECDVGAMLVSIDNVSTNGAITDDTQPPPASKGSRRPITLPFRRKKGRKTQKDTPTHVGTKDKDTESIESPEKDTSLDKNMNVDEEGFTIRPETPKGSKSSWGFNSNDSDSDSDDVSARKIHVKINPKDHAPAVNNDINELNAITKNLTLSSPTPMGGKRVSRKQRRDTPSPITTSQLRTPSGSISEMRKRPAAIYSSSESINIESIHDIVSKNDDTEKNQKVDLEFPEKMKKKVEVSVTPPVPAPRRISLHINKQPLPSRAATVQNSPSHLRFSTMFVAYSENEQSGRMSGGVSAESLDKLERNSNNSRSESYDYSSDDTSRSSRSLEDAAGLPKIKSPSLVSAKSASRRRRLASNITLRELVSSPLFQNKNLSLGDISEIDENATSPRQRVTENAESLTGDGRSRRQRDSPAATQSEGSFGDELLDLFGQNSASTKPKQPSDNKFADLNDLFSSQQPSTPKLTPQSSDISLDNLFATASDSNLSASKPDITLSTPNLTNSPVLRPQCLNVKNGDDKAAPNSAPLASSESWSSLSSLGGTPMESFTASRGPSPLTLMRDDPIPIAVAFTEVLNAYIKGTAENQCMVKVTGDVQLSFPAGIVRAFTSSPNPPTLSFGLKKTSHNVEFTPKPNLVYSDSSGVDSTFWFDMPALVSLVKKQFDANPSLPYCIVSALTYQLSSQNGHSLIPLHISNKWNCSTDTTDVNIEYSFNSNSFKSPLRNVSFLVPVNGGVCNAESSPPANWIAAQNRLSWKLPSPISISTSTGSLSSKLSLTKGPSKSCALAVQFLSEGALLSGCEFELTGQGYRLSLVKKKVISGKYLADAS